MENEKGIIKMTRQQLYDEIWNISLAGVAREHNLNYAKLIATCKKTNIHFPSSGYWTRRNLGKDVSAEVIPLAGSADEIVSLITKDNAIKHDIREDNSKKVFEEQTPNKENDYEPNSIEAENSESAAAVPMDGILDFLETEERERVWDKVCTLEINESTHLHKALIQYKKSIAEYKEKLRKAQNQTYYNPRVHKPDNEPAFFNEVSEEGIQRAIAILNALFKVIEQLGGTINDNLSMKIKSDVVRIRFAEAQDKVNHDMTKQEAQALVKYNDEVKHGHHYASKPQIRKYDYVYNGKLRIVFGEQSYIRDNESERLEDRLGDILIALYEKSEENRIERERREEEQRKRDEEARRQEELRKRKELEIQKVKELANIAEDYRIASDIRAYIQAMVDNGNEEATPEWIEWAQKKADWYDPTIPSEDEILGRRNHGKSKEEKDQELQGSVRRSWMW